MAETGVRQRWGRKRIDHALPAEDSGTPGAQEHTEPRRCCTLSGFFFVWFAGIMGAALMVGVVRGSATEGELPALVLFLVVLPAHQLSVLGGLYLWSRWKGVGSLRQDFGFNVRWRHASMVLVGVGLQAGGSLALTPLVRWLGDGQAPQEVVRDVTAVRGPGTSLAMVVSVTVLAPVVEEVLYRGLLLRALLHRLPTRRAVLATGAVFGAVHLFDTGLRPEALPVVVALGGLGVILAVLAVRDGTLSRPIFVHIGFNSGAVLMTFLT